MTITLTVDSQTLTNVVTYCKTNWNLILPWTITSSAAVMAVVPPQYRTKLATAFKVVDYLALNFGHAKTASAVVKEVVKDIEQIENTSTSTPGASAS